MLVSDIKRELEKIEIPKKLAERTKMGVRKAKYERKSKIKRPVLAAAIIATLSVSIFVTPPGQAMIDGLFQVTKFEKRKNIEEMSIGYGFENNGVFEEISFNSLKEAENMFNVKVPFPSLFLTEEKNKEFVEYTVGTNEQGEFTNLYYVSGTPERNYSVLATNNIEANPHFSGETTDGTGIEKDLIINGDSVKLFGINEIDGYIIYIEKDSWKLVVTCFDRGSSLEGLSDVKEEEIIKIAESIKW